MSGINHLYRHYDAQGELLYVGISLNALNRLAQHRDVSLWFNDIAKVTLEQFPCRKTAMDAETEAIQSENPKYNLQKRKKKPVKLEEEKKIAPEVAKVELIRKIVSVSPVYQLREAAHFLGMRPMDFMKLIDSGRIKTIKLPYKDEQRDYVTGFQIIEFLES
jgi:predicted GIY-YIG superfamily endonuclease